MTQYLRPMPMRVYKATMAAKHKTTRAIELAREEPGTWGWIAPLELMMKRFDQLTAAMAEDLKKTKKK